MKKRATFFKQVNRVLFVFVLTLCIATTTKIFAQGYYSIPDTNFATWLNANIPAAMNGNLMDTTHPSVLTRTWIDVENKGIANLDGIQYFTSLKTLDCGNGSQSLTPNTLTHLPQLPATLDTLICGHNQIASLPNLPNSLIYIACYENQLSGLPTLPTNLQIFDCSSNQLSSLPGLPSTITNLECSNNLLTQLPTLPNSLLHLYCGTNQLSFLPILPNSLYDLGCASNHLDSLPSLPPTLYALYCNGNIITHLPNLPLSLNVLDCDYNQLTALPTLPNLLAQISCTNNQINTLPLLPQSLLTLNVSYNLLDTLSSLPNGLKYLYCESNHMSLLQTLPNNLILCDCHDNILTTLPSLPSSLNFLYAYNNNISCFPTFPQINDSSNFDISNNPFNCLPNYIPGMTMATLSHPLCLPGNSNGCYAQESVLGLVFKDENTNCTKDSADQNLVNIPMKIYNSTNNLIGQTYTAVNGVYSLKDTLGLGYTVVVDTASEPYTSQCAAPGADSTFVSTGIDTINFPIVCKTGFDVGIRAAVADGIVFPGQQHTLHVNAGDMSRWFNLNCANGVNGTLQITLTGPVTYVAPAAGAITPSISGNTYTYTISDFASITNTTAFGLVLLVDSTAQAGDLICAHITITPGTDNDITNNTYQYCYTIVNSHDPNIKEVYPLDVPQGYTDWLTYTIHFQNTGTATAFNIRIADTLDTNLDLSTFQVTDFSHANSISLNGNVLTCGFANINLPDSTSNLAGSSGYVQYRIKPKSNLTAGTQIHNTAYIYFDYNPAIITNTTVNSYSFTTSLSQQSKNAPQVHLYPNPFSDNATLSVNAETNSIYTFELLDVLGKTVQSIPNITTKQFQINRNGIDAGVYFYRVYSSSGFTCTGKVIIR